MVTTDSPVVIAFEYAIWYNLVKTYFQGKMGFWWRLGASNGILRKTNHLNGAIINANKYCQKFIRKNFLCCAYAVAQEVRFKMGPMAKNLTI